MQNQGLGAWIHKRRMKSAAKTAIISTAGELSYGEFAERVDRLANALADRGIAPGDRVAYLGENHPAFLETFFACGTLGAIFVPLNTRLAPPEVQFALQDSGSRILIHARTLEPLAVRGSSLLGISHRMVVEDGPAGTGNGNPAGSAAEAGGQGTAVELLEEVIGSGSEERRDVAVSLDDPAMILYTSGTTGRPKGALLTHGNMTWNSINVLVDFDMASTDVALMIAPMFHVASLGMGVLPTLLKGATVVLEPKFEPGRTLMLIEKYKATSISGVPTTYQLLCEHPDWDKTDISSLNKLTCGGSAVPMRVLEAYEARGLSFTNGYGMTETAPGATTLAAEKSRPKAGSAGLPHFFTDIRIADPMGDVLPAREVGEIQISGPNVIHEYWNRPDATAESYADGVWFKSGDMGYVDEDGFLFISDRLKDMIISGGENIYPAEVEQVILELEAVSSAAVIGIPDEKWGEVPRAVVTVREGFAVTAEDIQQHLDGRLARYKIPKSVVIVEDLPRTASGKIRKADLRKEYSN
ncbi:acyl-CoA synthetase [Arthrobacter sp. NPDC055138]